MSGTSSAPERRTGGRSGLRALLLLNGALLAVLAAVTFGARADAQNRLRGEYTMVGGGVNGSDAAAVYVVDTLNQEMLAITYNPDNKAILGIGYRNLAADAGAALRRRPGN